MNEEKEFAPELIRQVLDLELGDNDSGETTVRGYLLAITEAVWRDGEGFSGKRPFGNGGWESDLYRPMALAGIVQGDEDGYVSPGEERRKADRLVLAAIGALAEPLPAPGDGDERLPDDAPAGEPAKVVVVTEAPASGLQGAAERHFPDGRRWEELQDGGLHVFDRNAHRVATYARGAWLSVREDSEVLPDSDGQGCPRCGGDHL